MSVNSVQLIGKLGQNPEIKYTQSGDAVLNFSLATDTYRKDAEKKTQWHKIEIWGKQAENCNKYLQKGSNVFVDGSIDYGNYEKEGVKVYTTTIKAKNIQFLDEKKND